MLQILNNQHPTLNGGNIIGNTNTPGTAFSNTQSYAVRGGNTQYAGSSTSAQALDGKGVMKITSGGSQVMPGMSKMSGGGRSRRHRRSRGSKKYARKRSLRYRLKHKKSGKRKHGHTKRRGQRGGYAQYLTNQAFTLGQRLPGFPLLPSQSALANPPPFMPYRNCPGGM
jgi:hypothetical protein